MKRPTIFALALLQGLLVSSVAGAAPGDLIGGVPWSMSMDRAATLYRLSLATEVDSEALRAAAESYEKVIDNKTAPADMVSAAKAGLAQTEARLENSDEMFRNVWSGAWRFRGDHEVFEWYDSAVEMALDRAWSQIVHRLTFRGVPRLPVYARCAGDDESCGILRDMVLLSAESEAHLRPLPDDLFKQYQPTDIGPPGHAPKVTAQLAKRLPETDLLLVDIQAFEPEYFPDPVSRVTVTVRRVTVASGESKIVAFSEDVGVDVIGRWLHSWGLLVLVALLALIASVTLRLGPTPALSAVMGLVLGLAGGALLMAANEVLDEFMPAMDDLAWDPDTRPLISTWLWPLGMGLVFSAGGVVLSLFTRETLAARLQPFVDLSGVRWEFAGLPVVMGALTFSGFHLPTEFGADGWGLILGLMAGIGLTTLGLGHVVLGDVEDRMATPVVVTGALALVGGTAAWVTSMLGMNWLVPLALGLTGLPALLVKGSGRAAVSSEETPTLIGEAGSEDGSLDRPTFVDRPAGRLAAVAQQMASTDGLGVVHLTGASGLGKTRWARQLIARLVAGHEGTQPKVAMAQPAQASDGADPAGSPPYELLEQLLSGILSVLNRLDAMEREESAGSTLADAGASLLENLPGIGLVMGLLPEGEETAASDRLKADVVEAVRAVLAERDLIWFVDDLHGADEESWEAVCHLVADLTERPTGAGRLVLVVAEQVRDRSRTADLGVDDIAEIALAPLDADGAAELVQSAGLRRPDTRRAEWLLSLATEPGNLLSVLRHLDLTEVLITGADGALGLPAIDDLTSLANPVPTDLVERELERLKVLPEAELLLLEMAAQCGQQFDAEDVAAGLGEGRMKVLNQLRQVELEHGLIEDRNEDDRFSFLMRITRQALCHRTIARRGAVTDEGEGIAEIARAFHAQVAESLIRRYEATVAGDGRKVSGEKIYRHLSKAGPRQRKRAPEWALVAAEQAAQLFAFKRAKIWIARAIEELPRPDEAQRDRMAFIYAQVLYAGGEQADRDEAMNRFKVLIASPHVDARQALLTWMEIAYEEKQRSTLESLNDELSAALQGRSWPEPGMSEAVRFYATLVGAQLKPRGDDTTLASLEQLEGLREGLSTADASDSFQMLLKARVCNEIALNLFFLREAPADRAERFEAAWRESLALKEHYGDLPGQAAAWGLYGDFHNFTLGELDKARAYYEKDVEILQRMGTVNNIPGLINKIGLTIYKQPEVEGYVARGLDHAQRSMKMAVELEREIDVFFAARQVMTIADEHALPAKEWTAAVDALTDELLGEIQSVGMKLGLAGQVREWQSKLEGADAERLTPLLARLPQPEPEG